MTSMGLVRVVEQTGNRHQIIEMCAGTGAHMGSGYQRRCNIDKKKKSKNDDNQYDIFGLIVGDRRSQS